MRIQVFWDAILWLGEWLLILQSWRILICRSDVAERYRMPHFRLPPRPKKLRFSCPALFKVTTITATATAATTATGTRTKMNKERRKERNKQTNNNQFIFARFYI